MSASKTARVMSASKTVVYYNTEASGDLVLFLFRKEHILFDEVHEMKLEHGLTYENSHKFPVKNFQAKLPEVFAFVALMLEDGIVPEGHNGPFKPERGATHFGSLPNDAEAVAAKRRRY